MKKNPPYRYTVRCSIYSEFPMDMLRHDSAEAASPADAELIRMLNERQIADCKDKHVLIELVSDWRGAPNTARWESFGCQVVKNDNPYRDISRDREVDPGELRRRLLGKINTAVLKHQGEYMKEPTLQVLREAINVCGQDQPHRENAIGRCIGARTMLMVLAFEYPVDDLAEALNCAALVLAADEVLVIKGMAEQVDLAVEALNPKVAA